MSGLMILASAWNCWILYKSRYLELLALDLLPLLNAWLIVRMQPAEVFSIGVNLVDVHLNWLTWFHHLLILKGSLLNILIDCMIFLSPVLDVTRMSMLIVSLLVQLDTRILFL